MRKEPTRVELTDRHLRALRPGAGARDVWDALTPGLMARVLPGGQVQFAIRYRHAGTRRRLKLGTYPALGLAAARKEARRAQTGIDAGHDPAATRQAAKRRPTDTVASLVTDYLKRRPHKRTADADERMLTVEVLPHWKDRSVRSLTRRDVRTLIERVVDRGSPVMANRLLSCVRVVLNFAVDHDWIDANPAARLAKPTREVSRDRVLTDDEIRALWRCLSRHPDRHEKQAPGRRRATGTADDPICPIGPRLADVQKIRLLTAARGGEVLGMAWDQLDLAAGWWDIPASLTKNGLAHRVPLTDTAKGIIAAQEADVKARTGLVFAGSGASVRDRAKKAPARLAAVLGFASFRGHDLRRTVATKLGALGIPREDIAAVLNHAQPGARATAVYDRHRRDGEKRAALEAWDRELARILADAPKAAIVVPMRGRR